MSFLAQVMLQPVSFIFFPNMQSSLDRSIWHYFFFFFYSQVNSDHIKLSSDVINCTRKKWERKSTLSSVLIHFVSNTLCSRLQHTHFSSRIFKRIFLFHVLFQKGFSLNKVSRNIVNFFLRESSIFNINTRLCPIIGTVIQLNLPCTLLVIAYQTYSVLLRRAPELDSILGPYNY